MINELTREALQKYYEYHENNGINEKGRYSKFEFFVDEFIELDMLQGQPKIHFGRIVLEIMNAIKKGTVDEYANDYSKKTSNYSPSYYCIVINILRRHGWVDCNSVSLFDPHFVFDEEPKPLSSACTREVPPDDPIFDIDGIAFNEHNLNVLLDWLNEEGKYKVTKTEFNEPRIIRFSTAEELSETLFQEDFDSPILAYGGNGIYITDPHDPETYRVGETDCPIEVLRELFPYHLDVYIGSNDDMKLKVFRLNDVGIEHWGKNYVNEDGTPMEFIAEHSFPALPHGQQYFLFALTKVPETEEQSFGWVKEDEVEFVRIATSVDYHTYAGLAEETYKDR